jgi:ATP-dependent DNA helicase RecG
MRSLLCQYPKDWEDRSKIVPLRDFARAPVCTVARVLTHVWIGQGKTRTLKVYVEDASGDRGSLICFNRPFMEKILVTGNYYRIWGVFQYRYGELQSSVFEVEAHGEKDGVAEPSKQSGFGQILPVYPLRAGLNQGMLRKLIRQALDRYAEPLENELPEAIIARDGLLSKPRAVRSIHFPESFEELAKAKETLVYEELFYLEVMVCRRAKARGTAVGSRHTGGGGAAFQHSSYLSPLQKALVERLPFPLTAGQIEAVEEINRDLDGPCQMARLLQGDVGSGKTLVSFLAALRVIEEKGQAAIMAPTELLSRQHAENAARLLEPLGVRPAFLTGTIGASGRHALLKSLASGDIDLVVGTHALFSRDVAYNDLRLVVIDEQHRFGVLQRQAVMAKGERPGLLMMSATPIPRTLALTVFGDMDISIIQDMPAGRKPVKTHLARESNEEKVYAFVRGELEKGKQAYFVYPLIEKIEKTEPDGNKGLKDAQSMAERLASRVFPEYSVALIHSKRDEEEKRTIMERFRLGEIRILVATSVVEVGVDVPNATCMVVEHAERFGLSALHQLRGRVGRGKDQSYCFLVYSDALTEDGKTRLKVMLENTDGFVIAEEDLKLRGPGQIAGTEQSGFFILGIADPVRDSEKLERARSDAFTMLEHDPDCSLPEYECVARVLHRAPPFDNLERSTARA